MKYAKRIVQVRRKINKEIKYDFEVTRVPIKPVVFGKVISHSL